MPYRCASRWFAAVAVCTWLLGCGGSETADESTRFAMPQSATQPSVAPRMRVLAAPPSPITASQLFASYPSIQGFIGVHQHTVDLQSAFTASGNGNVATATFAGRSGRVDHLFRFTLVRNLEHEYPNGINHPMKGAEEHWAWLKNFSLP